MAMHEAPFDGAGHTYKIDLDGIPGNEIKIEDYWDRVAGISWQVAKGNPAALKYAMRAGFKAEPLPTDDEVVYGKVGGFGHIVHVSELGERVS